MRHRPRCCADVGHGRYNFDHVVIGHNGVFCLNSKKSACTLQADLTTRQLRLHNRYDDRHSWRDERMLSQARRDAAALSALIEQRTGGRLWVQPVIVWWGRFPQEGCTVANVGIVHGDKLVERLTAVADSQRRTLTNPSVVADALAPGRRRTATRTVASSSN